MLVTVSAVHVQYTGSLQKDTFDVTDELDQSVYFVTPIPIVRIITYLVFTKFAK